MKVILRYMAKDSQTVIRSDIYSCCVSFKGQKGGIVRAILPNQIIQSLGGLSDDSLNSIHDKALRYDAILAMRK